MLRSARNATAVAKLLRADSEAKREQVIIDSDVAIAMRDSRIARCCRRNCHAIAEADVTPPQRHWRSYGTDPLPVAAEAMQQPMRAFLLARRRRAWTAGLVRV